MSGIYIPDMEMPTACSNCELALHFDGYNENDCPFNAFSFHDCPLVPVPPHGRLIDADALSDNLITKTVHIEAAGSLLRMVRAAPTIIEAEESEGDNG